ncbi:MAG: hypothetical protein BGO43_12305 [Gammaproteobacteria bacterium 39-13]|nr:hypothetical protein [Gammaproteobacteria bacterium]OJV94000.1 MAG: hypothetical protein BGO43_12305 [Gammaproteobacteria bacterium 39-13]
MLIKFSVVFFSLLFCSNCISKMVNSESYIPIQSQPDVSQIDVSASHAKVGEYIYRQAQQYKMDGIALHSQINIKNKNIFKPNVTISPQNLVKTVSREGYDYYVAKTTADSFKQEVLHSLNPISAQTKGIKIKKDDSRIKVFTISGNIENSYPFPKETHWEKISLIDMSKPASENSLKYIGVQEGNLLFQHVKIDNVVKKNLLKSSSKASTYSTIITVPKMQKTFNVDDKLIHILEVDSSGIQFRLSKMNNDAIK